MAAARAVPSLGGYDDEFVNAVEDDLHCAICQLPLKEAVQTGKCGHRFCRQCLDEHFKRLELNSQPLICPVDRNNLIRDKDVFPDKATERKILSFIIRCPSEGCQWTGELRSKDNHLASCPLKVVSCTNKNCDVTLTRNKLQEHVTTTCPWRILRCTFCGVSHPQCKKEVHQNECKKFPLNCPQSCGAVIAREEISTHTDNHCPLTIIFCPYAQMGCTIKILRRELECHCQSATRLHLDLACVKLNNTQKEFKETTRKLKEEFKETTRKLKEEFKENTGKLEEKINALENTQMQISLEDHIYNWKINNFSQVLSQANSGETPELKSAPFYRYGYKCKLSLNPNGFGDGQNTHLSIFLHIMKGEYDAILPWPFNKMITFTLIDQQQNPNDRENIVMSFTDPTHINFARPVIYENDGLGLPKFVSHNKLKERRYMVDDTIFIQLLISPP